MYASTSHWLELVGRVLPLTHGSVVLRFELFQQLCIHFVHLGKTMALLACRCKSDVTSSHPAQSDLRHEWISKSTSVTGEGGHLFKI